MSVGILKERIYAANASGRHALIPFVTAGYPTIDRFWDIMEDLDHAGADIIEIGVPFSDPVADGPVVEAASQRAINNGVTLHWLLEALLRRKHSFRAGLILMGYYNPFLKYGLDRLAANAAAVGISGLIVPDLPLEESADMRTALKKYGLSLLPLVGVNTSRERMVSYAENAEGYAYLASVLGTTGQRAGFPPELAKALENACDIFKIPVALGFGLSRPEQLHDLPVKPRAVVFGSALLNHIENGGKAGDFIRNWL